MKYCSNCAQPVTVSIPDGDNRERFVCTHCDTIHYQNPNIVAGCIVTQGDKFLMCKRAIEPRYGLWTVPAGFMENQESTQEAARRETFEEATATLGDINLFGVYNLIHINQVYMLFRGELIGDHAPGSESLETQLVSADELPWQEMAFPVITLALQQYLTDRDQNDFKLHSADLVRVQGTGPTFRVEIQE